MTHTAKIRLGDALSLIDELNEDIALLLTDPPYGMAFQSNRRIASAKRPKIKGDNTIEQAVSLLRAILDKTIPKMKPDSHTLIFTGWRYEPQFRQAILDAGLNIKGSLVWIKHNHGAGDLRGSFAPRHERIIHAVKGCPRIKKRLDDVFKEYERPRSEHPTQKPVPLLEKLIATTTDEGDLVYDPFAGSGSTLLAACNLNRDYYGTEIDPKWFEVAREAVRKKIIEKGQV